MICSPRFSGLVHRRAEANRSMRPAWWHPPIELSAAEQASVGRSRLAKLFVFRRRVRHELLSHTSQGELAGIFADSPKGQPPLPPAQLALVTHLQAYMGASDDEAIEALKMDRRWQLGRFRAALITHGLDRRLIERTVELSRRDGGFCPRQLRAALDSSPLWGGSRVKPKGSIGSGLG
jgi:hypothetical protein